MSPLQKFDYVVAGAGASGMAFLDTLLLHHPNRDSLTIALVDKHQAPGGHWNDSYPFVTLHQSSVNYGVESFPVPVPEHVLSSEEDGGPLPAGRGEDHLATREELLTYYAEVLARIRQALGPQRFVFFGGWEIDFGSEQVKTDEEEVQVAVRQTTTVGSEKITLTGKMFVDARWTTNDVPALVPPSFPFDANVVKVVPPNALKQVDSFSSGCFVVLGGGKTGQDAVLYLLDHGVLAADIVWVVPTATWITARNPENGQKMDTALEFLGLCADGPPGTEVGSGAAKKGLEEAERRGGLGRPVQTYIEKGLEEAERRGLVYRLLTNQQAEWSWGIAGEQAEGAGGGFEGGEGEGGALEQHYQLESLLADSNAANTAPTTTMSSRELPDRSGPLPTRSMNATLSLIELKKLQSVRQVIYGRGRITSIETVLSGRRQKPVLHFDSGWALSFPWRDTSSSPRPFAFPIFVHCTAGAFNFSARGDQRAPPIFERQKITIQKVGGYPGFCFNASLIARVEALGKGFDGGEGFDEKEKNWLVPLTESVGTERIMSAADSDEPLKKLGEKKSIVCASAAVGGSTDGRGLLAYAFRLQRWYGVEKLAHWLHGNRLFSLTMQGYSLEEGRELVGKIVQGLADGAGVRIVAQE